MTIVTIDGNQSHTSADGTETRVSIDSTRCQGHGRCAIIAPDVFDSDDLGKGTVLLDPCPQEFRAAAEEAAFTCPETAITVSAGRAPLIAARKSLAAEARR
jgi:ferredoxin